MRKTYRPYCPEQQFLLPPSLQDWLPENHLAPFVSEMVSGFDLSAIEAVYERESGGHLPYHPEMMTTILVYGYCEGYEKIHALSLGTKSGMAIEL